MYIETLYIFIEFIARQVNLFVNISLLFKLIGNPINEKKYF
jgi:hypothetical protein